MEIVLSSDRTRWNEIVSRFASADIYYRNEYVMSLLHNSQDKGVLFYHEDGDFSVCYPMIIKDIAWSKPFIGVLPEGTYFDMEVPYGYGGPICQGRQAENDQTFIEKLTTWCREQHIVSQFLRFHPVLKTQANSGIIRADKAYMHHTVSIWTHTKEDIMANMDSKKRNMVRKAAKNGVEIVIDEDLAGLEEFKRIYTATMDQHNAADMYYFDDAYYDFLKREFSRHTVLFRAVYEGKTIAASLFFYDESAMHYHLSGKDADYRHLAPTDLLLYEAACWAADRGICSFHLGGGMAENDSLFEFKKGFSKSGILDFYIGRTVFMPEAYEHLLSVRTKMDSAFDRNNRRMIQYRA